MTSHAFADRWSHHAHHYPLLRSRLPASARRVLDVGCGEGTLCRCVAETEVRDVLTHLAGTGLPGSHYRRLPLWRCLVTWRKR